jgi:hypothetical protein
MYVKSVWLGRVMELRMRDWNGRIYQPVNKLRSSLVKPYLRFVSAKW